MRIIFIYLLIFSCSNVDTNKGTVDQIPVPTSIVSFFENKPEIIRLDSSYTSEIEIWTQMINFTEKFSDLIDNEINHKSKIKSLSIELKKIKKETIPGKYKTSPIIGRIRVVNTYLQKIDSYLEDQGLHKSVVKLQDKVISVWSKIIGGDEESFYQLLPQYLYDKA